MKKIIILIIAMLLMGCSNTEKEVGNVECEVEEIHEYESYKGLVIDGRDRTHLTDRPELKEGMDPAIIGTWINDEGFIFEIVIFYEDGRCVRIGKTPLGDALGISEYGYNFIDDKIDWMYGTSSYEIKVIDGTETLIIVSRVFKRLK